MSLDRTPHVVYLLMCSSDVVYVGCTSNLTGRLKQHADKVYTSVVQFQVKTKKEGLFWERRWLLFFAPKYNWMPTWCREEKMARRIHQAMRF